MGGPDERERDTLKDQRQDEGSDLAKQAQNAAKAEEDGMFFGTSPFQRKELRQTDEEKHGAIKLDSLDLNAIDREKYHAPEKVGTTVRLIDLAIGNEPPPSPAAKAAPPPAKPGAKPWARHGKPGPQPGKPGAQPGKSGAQPKAGAQPRAAAAPQPKAGPPQAKPAPRPQPAPSPRPAPHAPSKSEDRKTGAIRLEDLGLTQLPRKVGQTPSPGKPQGPRTDSRRAKRSGPRR